MRGWWRGGVKDEMTTSYHHRRLAMRGGLVISLIGCCMSAWADELAAQGHEIKVLTAAHARAALAGTFDKPELVSPLQASDTDHELKNTREVVVVHADEVEPLAFKALSSRYGVVYRNLRRIDEECQEALGRDRIRPSLPSLESITPDLATRLSKCKDAGVHHNAGSSFPLHLCGLRTIDEKSLRELRAIPLCLCGLMQLTEEQARWLMIQRNIHSDGVLLSRQTQIEEDTKKRLRPDVVGKEHNHRGPLVPSFDPGEAFWIHRGIRLINDRCQHRLITFVTPLEHRARQPPPKVLPPLPDPFEPD